MALGQFAEPPLTTMIETFAASPTLTVVVGAGVSAEARLPQWRELVETLLARAAVERLELSEADHRAAWVAQVMGGESPLGAAAIAEALADGSLPEWIPEALYDRDAERFQPGPIARQLAPLRQAFGAGLNLLTTNYDDLAEAGLVAGLDGVEAVAYSGPHGPNVPPTDGTHQRIVHLHGFLARDGRREGQVVLTETDYQQVAANDWQAAEVGHALMQTPCLFIGSSLTDPNLLRYLHRHTGPASPAHFAIFTRQDAYAEGTPPEVIRAREAALEARWRSNALEIVFVDHYAEIAQALAEIARAKEDGAGYVPLPQRLSEWYERVAPVLLLPPDEEAFVQAQEYLHRALRIALADATDAIRSLGHDPGDEVLSAALFLIDASGRDLTVWANTDRVHRDPRTIEAIPIDEHSPWAAVRAFCRGAPLGEPRNVYASRWKYIHALPFGRQDGLPVGVLTVASLKPKEETILDGLPDTVQATFDETLRETTRDILDIPFASEG